MNALPSRNKTDSLFPLNNKEDKVKEGTSTVEIREWCLILLSPLDAKAVRAYQEYKKPTKKKK